MWFVCGVCFLTVMASAVNAITVTPTYPLKNSAFTITATATGTSLSWIIDSTVLTGCTTALSFCEYVTPIRMPNANITIDSVTKISRISISNANQTLNGGLYDATGSVSKTVIVSTLPNSIRWKSHPVNGSSVDTGKWIAETSCAYPYDKITMDFTIFVEGVINSIQRVSTSSQSESCESPERMVLAELVLDSNSYANKRVYVVANASHDFFPNIPDIQGDQSNVVMFKGLDTTTDQISTTTNDEQSTSNEMSSVSTFTFQTTETTDKMPTFSSTLDYETSEATVSTEMLFVNGEHIGERHLYLILVTVIASACGIIVFLAIIVIIVNIYCNRLVIPKRNKYVKSENTETDTENYNSVQHTKGKAGTRKQNLHIKIETTGNKNKKYGTLTNKQQKEERVKKKPCITDTTYEFGQKKRNDNEFDFKTINAQRKTRVHNMQESVFHKKISVPTDSQININDRLVYWQTKKSEERICDSQNCDNIYPSGYHQDKEFNMWNHHFVNRRTHVNCPSDQHRPETMYFNNPKDRHKSNTSHSLSSYEYCFDNLAYDRQQPYSTSSNFWY